jgi:prepilin-type N-terminal cleavage/methylation domain-containing protein
MELKAEQMRTLMIQSQGLKKSRRNSGFTLIELVIVMLIIGALGGIVATRTNSFSYWQQEGYIRSLSETINFLHHQAVVDQAFYRMEFDMANGSYKIGILKPDEENAELADLSSDVGNLSFELAAYINPGASGTAIFIPPPSLPSLANSVFPPLGLRIRDVRTMRGLETEGNPYIMFSPRGFSEFAVVHITLPTNETITILVNPFTGITKVLRADKDFTWTYGRNNQS